MIHIDNKPLRGLVYVKDERPQGTNSGTFQGGDWRIRVLNVLEDPEGLAVLSSNKITLDVGLWECDISCPAYQVDRHQARLWNDTKNEVLKSVFGDDILGTSERANSGTFFTNRSFIQAIFLLSEKTSIEVHHMCSNTRLNDGFGDACNFSNEVYTIGKFRRASI